MPNTIKYCFVIVMLWGLSVPSLAQVTPCFEITDQATGDTISRACAPVTVIMMDCSSLPPSATPSYDSNFVFGQPVDLVIDSVFTYNSPGTYNIVQMFTQGGITDSTHKVFEVLDTPIPQFSVTSCEGFQANVTIDESIYDEYIITWGDGSPDDTIPPLSTMAHNYPDATPRNITVTGLYNLSTPCTQAAPSISITPYNVLIQPDITFIEVLQKGPANGQIQINFTADPRFQYEIQQSIGLGAYTAIDTVSFQSGSQSITYSGLNTTGNRYCYRIRNFDDCGNEVFSEELCSMDLTVSAVNNQNDLSWNNDITPSADNYTIIKDGVVIGTTNSTTYSDTNVICGINYCYRIVANSSLNASSGDSLHSISNQACVTAISTDIPPAIAPLQSTVVNDNYIQLLWNRPGGTSITAYSIQRSVNGGAFSDYATTIDTFYNDNKTNVDNRTYCYRIYYEDSCGNVSPFGTTTCPIHLTGQKTNTTTNDLSWSTYTGYTTAVMDYVLEKLDANGNVYFSVSLGTSTTYTDMAVDTTKQVILYRIRAVPVGPDTFITYSNIIEIRQEPGLLVPNAFTPNGDGLNDTFKPLTRFINEFTMIIYNRWGEPIFQSNDRFVGWDGNTPDGAPAPMGSYTYKIKVVDFTGEEIAKRGNLTLLR